MASQNTLLGSGLPAQPIAEGHKEREQKKTPCFCYHKDCPQGRLVKYDDELEKLDKEGWVDHPAKVLRLPGHEKKYDDFVKLKEKLSCNKQIIDEIPKVESMKSPDAIRAEELKAASDLIEKKRQEEEKNKLEFGNGETPGPACTCLICGKTFESMRQLNMHGIGAHRDKEDLTPDEIKIKEEEEKNEKDQEVERVNAVSVYTCKICNKDFNRLYKYTAHNRKTHGILGSVPGEIKP